MSSAFSRHIELETVRNLDMRASYIGCKVKVNLGWILDINE